jgi:PIN domain nuclease of toxin-antitoxin system
MRLILDTVTFIWAASSPQRLCRAAMAALRKETAVREISVVSLTEIAVKQISGKLTFGKGDAIAGVVDLRLRVLPYAADHRFRLFDLPAHHYSGSRSTSPSAAARNGSNPSRAGFLQPGAVKARRPRAPARGRSEARNAPAMDTELNQ